ncbi:MAG: hypothetical protein VX505_00295 [Chloroflexota bacterium]|nr:hypothetical protein [Chloroflexota bacterium]
MFQRHLYREGTRGRVLVTVGVLAAGAVLVKSQQIVLLANVS